LDSEEEKIEMEDAEIRVSTLATIPETEEKANSLNDSFRELFDERY
jgi:hypothetical protein